jgi:nucleotide-binding universal stress UspA family protein
MTPNPRDQNTGDLKVVAWIDEFGWEACVDAAAALPAAEIVLLHVAAPVHHGPGLLGRHARPDLEVKYAVVAAEAAEELLSAAEERLAGVAPVRRVAAGGRPEEVVIEACADADVLVLTRNGERPGPHSLEHATRFVVDHAPCTVLLTWP